MQKILDIPFDTLRNIGLSNAKTTYVKNTAAFFLEKKLTDKKLHGMTNDELLELLTQIKGVGKWTVEMLLMFSLGREDIFSTGDLGIQQAMMQCYGLKNTDKKKMIARMEKISLAWSPYRTYACLHLWQWKDNK
jgi:DNA-3-methyladenine glycosylase II